MNIIEAIKSGRPFRKVGCDVWWTVTEGFIHRAGGLAVGTLTAAEMTAEYEIQEPSVTITASQFWEAGNAVIANYMEAPKVYVQDAMNILARRLGLGSKP